MSQEPARRSPYRFLLFALASALAALVVTPAAHGAGSPGFYASPATLPDGGPGTLIRSEPLSFARAFAKPPAGTSGWRMLYTSTGATGERTVVSGSLLIPAGGSVDGRIVTIGVGMHGMGDSCGPSQQLEVAAEPDLATMSALLKKGYAVAITDYQGVGTAGQHAFAVNTALGRNVLDAVRAARQVPETGLAPDGDVGISGYSEGGGAAGSAIEQAGAYAPEFHVVGSVVGGMLADPLRAVQLLDGNWFMALEVAGVIGYNQAYPELGLAKFLNPVGQFVLKNNSTACAPFVARFMLNQMSWYFKTNPLKNAAWRARMRENIVGNLAPDAPVYMYHGRLDEALMVGQTKSVRDAWCRAGANVRFKLNPFGDHFSTQGLEERAALNWLDDRFAGKPAVSNC